MSIRFLLRETEIFSPMQRTVVSGELVAGPAISISCSSVFPSIAALCAWTPGLARPRREAASRASAERRVSDQGRNVHATVRCHAIFFQLFRVRLKRLPHARHVLARGRQNRRESRTLL